MMKRRRQMEMRFLSKQIGCLGDPKLRLGTVILCSPTQSGSGALRILYLCFTSARFFLFFLFIYFFFLTSEFIEITA